MLILLEKTIYLGVKVGVFDGATRATITPMVHDCIIVGVSGVSEVPFNILIGLMCSNYNVLVASIDR